MHDTAEMNCTAIKVPSHSVCVTSGVFLAPQFPPCAVVCLRQLQRRRRHTNICCISLINASPCHSLPLKCTWPARQSVQHIAAYGDFTVHSQPTANISHFRSENMPSVKKKPKNMITAMWVDTFLFWQKLEKHYKYFYFIFKDHQELSWSYDVINQSVLVSSFSVLKIKWIAVIPSLNSGTSDLFSATLSIFGAQSEPCEEETAGGVNSRRDGQQKKRLPELVDSGAVAAMPAVLTELDSIGSLIQQRSGT